MCFSSNYKCSKSIFTARARLGGILSTSSCQVVLKTTAINKDLLILNYFTSYFSELLSIVLENIIYLLSMRVDKRNRVINISAPAL